MYIVVVILYVIFQVLCVTHAITVLLQVIHPNGGFTKVWYTYKIIFFPVVLAALIWYWVRVVSQSREPSLLEKYVTYIQPRSLTSTDGLNFKGVFTNVLKVNDDIYAKYIMLSLFV